MGAFEVHPPEVLAKRRAELFRQRQHAVVERKDAVGPPLRAEPVERACAGRQSPGGSSSNAGGAFPHPVHDTPIGHVS